jgi:hypothetical protein
MCQMSSARSGRACQRGQSAWAAETGLYALTAAASHGVFRGMGILSKLVGSLTETLRASVDRAKPEETAPIPSLKAQLQPPRRVLILGCIAPEPATSFLWNEVPSSISIADYETVILDLTPFEEPGTIEFADVYLPEGEKFSKASP